MKREFDISKPNIGRMYDYWLGGAQNFAVDRQVADAILGKFPHLRIFLQLNRWFLQFIANRWAEEGLTQVLDLGSALPTQGHFNEYMPQGRILFSDIDALIVEHAQELLKDQPHLRFVQADVREPTALLSEAAQFFGNDRRLGIGFIGLCYFLSDEHVQKLAAALHAFSAPASQLAVSCFTMPPPDSPVYEVFSKYREMVKIQTYMRPPEALEKLITPWRVVENKSLTKWLDLEHLLADKNSYYDQILGYGLLAAHE
jgi:O-methyltransferase involved in polyketide biosynthesis